jgi:hypothetical protein
MTIYKWVKSQIKAERRCEPIGTRIKILEANKKKLRLKEFENLFDYWKFADTYYGQFRLANLELDAYKRVIIDWVWYLTMIQLFPYELKNCKLQDGRLQDFYTDSYNEILLLPKLTGDLESDKQILENVAYNNFYNPLSVVRQEIKLYDIIFKKRIIF